MINQRLTWLITLQGFLFGAFALSMAAQASSLSAEGLKPVVAPAAPPIALAAYETFTRDLDAIRKGIIHLGIFTSFTASIGVIAAFRAIRTTAKTLRPFPTLSMSGRPLYPMPIGRLLTSVMGMICGLMVPLLTAGIWVWIGALPAAWWIGVGVCFLLSAGAVFLRIQVGLE